MFVIQFFFCGVISPHRFVYVHFYFGIFFSKERGGRKQKSRVDKGGKVRTKDRCLLTFCQEGREGSMCVQTGESTCRRTDDHKYVHDGFSFADWYMRSLTSCVHCRL